MSGTQIQKARGLSYSSFSEYTGCNRKWFLRKVIKSPIDSDASEDTEAFNIGKAFHKALEDCKHDLTGFTFETCINVCTMFDVTDEDTVAMIYAMLSKYKKLHETSGLRLVACETIIDTPIFYGVIDAVMLDGDKFWVVDLKTAGTWQQSNYNTAASHTQLNIYAKYAKEIAYAVGLKDAEFAGCRLRTTVKSRLSRKSNEDLKTYIKRMSESIRSIDIAVPAESLIVDKVNAVHERAAQAILSATPEQENDFPPNFGNCMSYFKPCSYFSKCHGRNFTDTPKQTVLEV